MPFWFLNRFSRKLTAAFCLTVLASMMLTAFLITRAVRSFLIKDLTESLATQAGLIADQLNLSEFNSTNSARLQKKILRLSAVSSCRVTLIAPDGLVKS